MEKKNLIVKAVTGLTASSIIASSCGGNLLEMNESNYLNPQTRGLSDEGSPALLIDLSQDEMDYLNFLTKLANDIIKDPIIAKQFAKNPNSFIKEYGYKGEITLDEGMLKLILALGDEEINQAVNQNDMTTALALMESKGYLNNISEVKIQLTNEQIKKVYNNLGIPIDDSDLTNSDAAAVAVPVLVYALAIVYSQAAVVYNVGGAINVVAMLTVYAWSELWGAQSNEIDNVIEHNLPLKLWSLKGNVEDTYIATDKYINNQVERAIKLTKQYNPQLLKNINEEDLAKLIKYNIIQNFKN